MSEYKFIGKIYKHGPLYKGVLCIQREWPESIWCDNEPYISNRMEIVKSINVYSFSYKRIRKKLEDLYARYKVIDDLGGIIFW